MKKVHTIKTTPNATNLNITNPPDKVDRAALKTQTDKVDRAPYPRAKAQEQNLNCNLALKKKNAGSAFRKTC